MVAGILIAVHQAFLIRFFSIMVHSPRSLLLMSTWIFLCWTSRGGHSKTFSVRGLLSKRSPSWSKVIGWWWVGHRIIESPQVPFTWIWDSLGLGTIGTGIGDGLALGLGLGLDNKFSLGTWCKE